MINSPKDLITATDIVQCGRCRRIAEPLRKVCQYTSEKYGTFYVVYCIDCSEELGPSCTISLADLNQQCWRFRT